MVMSFEFGFKQPSPPPCGNFSPSSDMEFMQTDFVEPHNQSRINRNKKEQGMAGYFMAGKVKPFGAMKGMR